MKIRKKPIYVDFNSYIFTFVTCKPGLKLNLDIDPDPTKAKFLDPDPGLEGPAALYLKDRTGNPVGSESEHF